MPFSMCVRIHELCLFVRYILRLVECDVCVLNIIKLEYIELPSSFRNPAQTNSRYVHIRWWWVLSALLLNFVVKGISSSYLRGGGGVFDVKVLSDQLANLSLHPFVRIEGRLLGLGDHVVEHLGDALGVEATAWMRTTTTKRLASGETIVQRKNAPTYE